MIFKSLFKSGDIPDPVATALQKQSDTLVAISDMLLQQRIEARSAAHPNPLVRHGRKVFSQADEDGITLEIIRRLGLETGTFAEFGVGRGLENNTLALLALGWKGFWVDCLQLAFDASQSKRLTFFENWVTLENIADIYSKGVRWLGGAEPDLVSLDLDGNDSHFLRKLLANGCRPAVFIVEYNARFAPPIAFEIAYDPDQRWDGSDYQGASLSTLVSVLEPCGYKLICCNAATGVNAFFVRDEFAGLFPETPEDIADIFVEPSFHLFHNYAHPVSPRTIERIVED